MKILLYIILLSTPSTISAQEAPKQLTELLTLAANYRQIERCTNLISNDTIMFDIPCIAPLYADDFSNLHISSYYGNRLHPIRHEYNHHSGIDLPGRMGDKVYATANGIVNAVAQDLITGKYIKIQHKYGFETLYGHLKIQVVNSGDTVRIGKIIGYVGNTGQSTGPHLHYTVKKNNIQQNPLPFCYLYMKWLKKAN